MKYIAVLILSFYIYGFAGWIWESIILPLIGKYKIRNRGFLNGPIIPIYGVGAICMVLLFEPSEKVYSIFLESGVIACFIEYITSWMMEKIYHRRWWDYSHKPFHLNGRICLEGFLCFGVLGVVCVRWLQPMLLNYFDKYNLIPLIIVATVFTTFFILDIIQTIYQMNHFDEKVERIKQDLFLIIENIENVNNSRSFNQLLDKMKDTEQFKYKQLMKNKTYFDKRMINAFPQLFIKDRKKK